MMSRRALTAIALGIAILGVLGAMRGVLNESNSEGPATSASGEVDAETLVSGADLDQTIVALEARVEEQEGARSYTELGVAYLQRVRETGDPTYYSEAEGALERALELEPDNFEATTAMGALALGRHDFEGALALGLKAKEINPDNAHNYGVIGDALLELGRYDEAFAAFQTMVDLRPDLSSYARVSYARELTGDIEGAIEWMKRAREAGGPRAENVAYTGVLLGNLYFNRGDIGAAESEYERAAMILPDYPPALAGLGRVAAARGNLDTAIARYELAASLNPLVENVTVLGDLYAAAGRDDEAARQYELVETIVGLEEANGADLGMEIALFNADHGVNLDEAVAKARAAYARRPGVHTADVLAWTLNRSGQSGEAALVIEEALELGGRDPLVLFHAGMIAYANADFTRAADLLGEALETNPHFSILFADEARRVLAEVRVAVAGGDVG
jgi:tetratricopeptide (TPR) repeat protein